MLLFNHKIVEMHLPLLTEALIGAQEWKHDCSRAQPERGRGSQHRPRHHSTLQLQSSGAGQGEAGYNLRWSPGQEAEQKGGRWRGGSRGPHPVSPHEARVGDLWTA